MGHESRVAVALLLTLSAAMLCGCSDVPPRADGTYAVPCPPPPPSYAGGTVDRRPCAASNGLFLFSPPFVGDALPRYFYVPGVYPPVVIGGNP